MKYVTRRNLIAGSTLLGLTAVGCTASKQSIAQEPSENTLNLTTPKTVVIAALNSYFNGLKNKDISRVPFASNVTFATPLLENPVTGEQAVRELTANFANRLIDVRVDRHIVDGNFACSRFEIDWSENVVAHSIDYFRFSNGKILSIEVYFDPRKLLTLFERQQRQQQ